MFLVLPILLIGSATVFAQQGGMSMNTSYTEPAYLGQSMTVWVTVQNLASIPMQVSSVTVGFDWYQTLNGETPRVLQAGEKSVWEFDNVQIPSNTWTGRHTFDASVMAGWADSTGGWSNTLSSPLRTTTAFAVTESPPQPPQGVYTSCNNGFCVSIYQPSYVTPLFSVNQPSQNPAQAPDLLWPVVALVLFVVVVVLLIGRARSKPGVT